MAARRHITNKLHSAYRRASKKDRGRILDKVMTTTGVGRSTARRMLTGPVLPDPGGRSTGADCARRDTAMTRGRPWSMCGR